MRRICIRFAVLGSVFAACVASPAMARNTVVEDALRSRPDLSSFYQGLVSTGVINELQEGKSYTVFAPTNEAFARLSPAEYPCFYSVECRQDVAQVLRNHIVPGEKHVADLSEGNARQAGIMSLFSINDHHIIASEPYRGTYEVNGQAIVSENQLAGGVLYKVDGVLASQRDMAEFIAPKVVVAGTDLPPRTPAGTVVTVTTNVPAQ